MASYTATIKGTQKLYGFYGNGNGATYAVTVTNGTGVMKKFDVIRRPIRGGIPNVVATGGSGEALNYTENARFDFELEVWADVTTAGTFTATVTSSAGGDNITLASYATDPLTGGAMFSAGGQDAVRQFLDVSVASIATSDLYIDTIDPIGLVLPNPYASQANAPAHPGCQFFEHGWNGARYWMAYTPYPAVNSAYENPTVASSNDGVTWFAKGRQPLVDKPTNGYNADTHLFMSPDNLTMYLAFRERDATAALNKLKVMRTTDGATWSTPVEIMSGSTASQDFASPSIWWNGTGWTLIAHNLDAGFPYVTQRYVSSTDDVYGAWGAASTVTIPAFGATNGWWHSFHRRLSSGQVVALFQDNRSAGQPGFVYWAESSDDGATYAITGNVMAGAGPQGGTGVRGYRSAYALRQAPTGLEVDVFFGDFTSLKVYRHIARPGANKIRKDFLARQSFYLSLGAALPSDCIWADTFTRADSAVAIGTASSGGTYTVSSGTWGIASNKAYAAASGRLLAAGTSPNHEVSVKFADLTLNIQQWLLARVVDGNNYWRCGTFSNAAGLSTLVLQSVVGGAITVNREMGVIMRGDVLTLRMSGVICEVLVNGLLQHTNVMTSTLSGTGFGVQSNVGATSRFDDLVCCLI